VRFMALLTFYRGIAVKAKLLKNGIITIFWIIVVILLFKASGIKVFTDQYDKIHIVLPANPEE